MTSKEQWIQLHTVCLDTVRSAIQGITPARLKTVVSDTLEPVGEILNHIIGAEIYWLKEVKITPLFSEVDESAWKESAFLDEFAKIEQQYSDILREKGLDKDILFGLGRACQHALYHYANIVTVRRMIKPDWTEPFPLRWERAVDYISDLLIADRPISIRYDK
jgi:hypothetical protein